MLTPEEQAELAELRQQFAPPKPQAASTGLSPEEQAELAALRGEFGGERQPGQSLQDLPKDPGVVSEGIPQPLQPQRSFGEEVLDRAQTQLESFGNTISMGYLPHIQAAFEKINPDPSGGLDNQLREQGFTVPEQSYVNLRDENLRRQEAQAQRNPYDAAAGMIAGVATTAPIMASGQAMLNGGKAAMTGFQRLRDSARLGGTLGLISNPGDVEGVVSPLQATERLKSAGTGAAIGGVTQVAGDSVAKVGEAVKKAPAALEKIGNITAVKAIGALPKDLKKLFGSNNAHEIGDTLLKKGIVTAGDTVEEMAIKAKSAMNSTGKRIGEILKATNDELTDPAVIAKMSPKDQKLLQITKDQLDGAKLAAKAEAVIDKNLKNNLVAPEIKGKVKVVLDEMKNKANATLLDLQEWKVSIDKHINYNKEIKDAPEVQKQLKVVRDMINDKIESRVRVLGKVSKNKELIKELKVLKKDYGHFAKGESIASNRAKEIEGHKWLSLSENLAGGTGATIGAMTGDSPEERFKNAMLGFAAGAGAKKADKFLTPAVANAAKRLSVVMKKPANFAKYAEPLIEAAKRSPEEFQALVNQFGKDPEFIKIARPVTR